MKIKVIYEKIIYIIIFLVMLITQILKATEYPYQANACDNYQFSNSLTTIKSKILEDCKVQFVSINNKIRIIDSYYQQTGSDHRIALKLMMPDLSIANFEVKLIVDNQCQQFYKNCSKTCNSKIIKEYICKDYVCLCE